MAHLLCLSDQCPQNWKLRWGVHSVLRSLMSWQRPHCIKKNKTKQNTAHSICMIWDFYLNIITYHKGKLVLYLRTEECKGWQHKTHNNNNMPWNGLKRFPPCLSCVTEHRIWVGKPVNHRNNLCSHISCSIMGKQTTLHRLITPSLSEERL